MYLEDDPEDEQPEVELEEEDAPEDDPDEPAVEDDEEVEVEQDEEPAEDDLPDDPAELKRIAREERRRAKENEELAKRFETIAVGGKKDTPQTPAKKSDADEDEFQPHLNEAYQALVSSEEPDLKVVKKALLSLTGVVMNTRKQRAMDREEMERRRRDDVVEAQIPPKYKKVVAEFVEQFGTEKSVAWQMIKGQLYDAAVARAKAKKAPAKKTDEDIEAPPARGKAAGTAMRPVPPKRDGGGSGNLITLKSGLKIRADHTPESYAKMMDDLESKGRTADRREILALRNQEKVRLKTRP